MKPKTYKEQKSCYNCKHCIIDNGQDDAPYCCNVDNDFEPISYSAFKYQMQSEYKRMFKWVDENRVEPNGVCDKQETREI